MKTSLLLSLCLIISLLLQACTTTPVTLNYFDFGTITKSSVTAPSCHLPPIYLANITAPSAINSDLMWYRLLYANDQQTHTYAQHRWIMTPAHLLTQRIKMQLANDGVTIIDNEISESVIKNNDVQLRIELNDFSQYFDDPAHSYAQIKIRATMLRGRTLLAQTTLQQQVPADAANAPAGALAMRTATDELILNLSNWLCKQVQP